MKLIKITSFNQTTIHYINPEYIIILNQRNNGGSRIVMIDNLIYSDIDQTPEEIIKLIKFGNPI